MSETKKTTCRGCHENCGVIVTIENGKVKKIEGDPNHPKNEGFVCPKGISYKDQIDHTQRIKYPMKRVGERGEGEWERITWNEALDTIANELQKVKEKYGAESIAFGHGDYRGTAKTVWQYFFTALGTPNSFHTDGHYCYQPVQMSDIATYGSFITSETGPDYENSDCIFLWGGNPVMSHPTRAKDIMKGIKKGAQLLVVDPRLTEIASKADLWLQVRPSTDGALALAILNVIINDELYDKEFVEDWCYGFDKLKERVQKFPPKKASEITWVPKEKIIKAARMYSKADPASLHIRQGLQLNVNNVQSIRALSCLLAITGNFDIKGGNIVTSFPEGYKGIRNFRNKYTKGQLLPREVQEKRLGAKEFPLFSGPDGITNRDCFPRYAVDAMITEEPYPIKACVAVNDPITGFEDSKRLKEGLLNLDFFAVSEFYLTPTAELADIVLPAATWLEKDELVENFYHNMVGRRQKCVQIEECKDETEMIYELADRMDIDLPWNSVDEFSNYFLEDMDIDFEELKEMGIIKGDMEYKKYEKEGFNTPTGKVELYSTLYEDYGYDPLPDFEEPPKSPFSEPEVAKDYPYIMISGGRHIAYYHGQGRQVDLLRELCPDPLMEINPKTAEENNIDEGDWVFVKTPDMEDHVEFKAHLTKGIDPRVIHVQSHWWFPEEEDPEHGCWKSNINAIIPSDPPYSEFTGSPQIRGCLCDIEKKVE